MKGKIGGEIKRRAPGLWVHMSPRPKHSPFPTAAATEAATWNKAGARNACVAQASGASGCRREEVSSTKSCTHCKPSSQPTPRTVTLTHHPVCPSLVKQEEGLSYSSSYPSRACIPLRGKSQWSQEELLAGSEASWQPAVCATRAGRQLEDRAQASRCAFVLGALDMDTKECKLVAE